MSIFRRGRIGRELDEEAAEYTSSLSFDHEILAATVWVNAVHLKVLAEKNVIPREELSKALKALRELVENPPDRFDPRMEDIHAVIEERVSSASKEAGGMLAYGKSRNDAVAAAIRIRARERLLETALADLKLVEALLNTAERHVETVFPAYTHLQRAAPATLGFILHAHASRLLRNVSSVMHIYSRVNLSPLGAAAAVGTSAPIDRLREAQLLGFEGLVENALDATVSRDFMLPIFSYLLSSSLSHSSLVEELILYSSEEFGFIEIPDEYVSTSSIMPQKRNPVVAEVARTKAAEVMGELIKVVGILSKQAGGYNLDYQQITPKLWTAFKEVETTSLILAKMIPMINVDKKRAREACSRHIALAEAANRLVREYEVRFRDAHQLCAELSSPLSQNKLDENLFKKILEKYGIKRELKPKDFLEWLEPEKVVDSYSSLGSAKPGEVRRMVETDRRRMEGLRDWCVETLERLRRLYSSALSP